MTDNDIIKALECCVECDITCAECSEDCSSKYVIGRNTLDLINRQKAEIEMLHKVIETMTNEQLQFGFEQKRRLHKQNSKQSKSL